MLAELGMPFNGSDCETSRLCMDKFCTAQQLTGLEEMGIIVAPKQSLATSDLQGASRPRVQNAGRNSYAPSKRNSLLSSPRATVQQWHCATPPHDLARYIELLRLRVPRIPPRRWARPRRWRCRLYHATPAL